MFMVASYHIYQKCVRIPTKSSSGHATVKTLFYCSGILGFACMSMSGYSWIHYALMLLPMITLLSAYFLEMLYMLCGNRKMISYMLAVAILFISCADVYRAMFKQAGSIQTVFQDVELPYVQVANYIGSNTSPGDRFTVFDYNSRGAFLQNLTDDRIVDTYLYFPSDVYLQNLHMDAYMQVLERNHRYFVKSERNYAVPKRIQDYLDRNYNLIMNLDGILLYEYSAGKFVYEIS
jgi:hypothetical protein